VFRLLEYIGSVLGMAGRMNGLDYAEQGRGWIRRGASIAIGDPVVYVFLGNLECCCLHGDCHVVSNSLDMSISLVPHQPHRLQFRHSVWVLEHIHLSAPSFHYMMVT
jgi:hypothetical protein